MTDLAPLHAAREDAREHLHSLPNVESVGIGYKEVGGELTPELCLRVYVATKRPSSQLDPHERVPAEVGGIPTDVIVHEPIAPALHGLVNCGYEIGVATKALCVAYARGTNACFVKKNQVPGGPVQADHPVYLLTAAHVLDGSLAGEDNPVDEWLHQPHCDGTGFINAIARRYWTQLQDGGNVDAGLAILEDTNGNQCPYANYVWKLGWIKGTRTMVPPPAGNLAPGVAKTGQTTGKTFGRVSDYSFEWPIMDPHNSKRVLKTLKDQLFIDFDAAATKAAGSSATSFAGKGDSGAPLMDADVYNDAKKDGRMLVGIVVGAGVVGGVSHGVASRIENVFNNFGVKLA